MGFSFNGMEFMMQISVIGIILMGIAWFIISIFLCVWVYRDARQRYPLENPEPLLWLIVVLLTGILGLIIYLLVRPEISAEQFKA